MRLAAYGRLGRISRRSSAIVQILRNKFTSKILSCLSQTSRARAQICCAIALQMHSKTFARQIKLLARLVFAEMQPLVVIVSFLSEPYALGARFVAQSSWIAFVSQNRCLYWLQLVWFVFNRTIFDQKICKILQPDESITVVCEYSSSGTRDSSEKVQVDDCSPHQGFNFKRAYATLFESDCRLISTQTLKNH